MEISILWLVCGVIIGFVIGWLLGVCHQVDNELEEKHKNYKRGWEDGETYTLKVKGRTYK